MKSPNKPDVLEDYADRFINSLLMEYESYSANPSRQLRVIDHYKTQIRRYLPKSQVKELVEGIYDINSVIDQMWNDVNTIKPSDKYQRLIGDAQQRNKALIDKLKEQE